MVSLHHPRARRAALMASTVALGLLVTSTAIPAAVAALSGQTHDFANGVTHDWYTYANTGEVSSSTDNEEFCATAQAGDDPWSIAAQLDGVTYVKDATYTVSFDAYATSPVSIPMQGGVGYPAAFGRTIDLDGTSTVQHVEFDFTPADWPTTSQNPDSPLTDNWSTREGNISFQLGAQDQPFTFCFDNLSITGDTTGPTEPTGPTAPTEPNELIVGGDFEHGTLNPFYVAGNDVTAEVLDGVLHTYLGPGTTNRWDQIIGYPGIIITPETTYTLSFDASSTDNRALRVVLGDDDDPYTVLHEWNVPLTSDLTNYSYTFTAPEGFPLQPGEEIGTGDLTFQVGGASSAWTFQLDNVSLLSDTAPEAYTPDTGSRVRVNQVGYLPDGPKQATLVTSATEPVTWELLNPANSTVASGATVPAGVDQSAGLNVHEIDFGDFTTPGTYTLAADGEESYEFVIDADIYQQLRYDALNYFYLARSGIDIDGSIVGDEYARVAGHTNNSDGTLVSGSANLGDYGVACLTPEKEGTYWMYADWECNYTSDVVGGWYDAGDHGKYVVNGGIAVAQILSTYERTFYSPTAVDADLGDGTLNIPLDESSNGIPDALDEARWQLEWMMSMQVPADALMYAGMVHHKIADLNWTGLPLLPTDDPQERYLHRPSTAATLNFAAVAAQGARLWAEYDSAFAADLLAAGRVAWEAALATPELYAPAPNDNPSPGSGPYDDDNALDEFYWAAAEMYLTTGEQEFEDYVLASDYHTADIWTTGGFNWFETAALGRLNLATVESQIPGRAQIRQSVIDAAERYLDWQRNEPFGTAYPGADGEYDWGSNSAILNNQVVMGTAFDITSDQRFADAVLESMDYLLGRNALNLSYITGYGHVYSENQHSRWFARSLEPSLPNPPAGSVSGGPNSMTATWDPVIQGLYSPDHMCAPQFCYTDSIHSWSTNEITVNWNSAMSWVASFIADQASGNQAGAGQVVNVSAPPQDITVAEGTKAEFSVSATGSPSPSLQWQQLIDGVWSDIAGATSATLSVTAALDDDGTHFRVYASNRFGGFYTDHATLTVTEVTDCDDAGLPVTDDRTEGDGSGGKIDVTDEADDADEADEAEKLASTGARVMWAVLTAIILLAVGTVLAGIVRRGRSVTS